MAVQLPGDTDPTTHHFAVYSAGCIRAIASIYREGLQNYEGAGWRLRGMAVEPAERGQGYGGHLVKRSLQEVEKNGGAYLWCNARVHAQPFYERYSFSCISNVFDIPGTGPHVVMVRMLTR